MSSSDRGSPGADEFGPPSDNELQILTTMLNAEFPGHEELLEQLGRAQVRRLDADGSLSLRSSDGPPSAVMRRIPVEAELEDEDGVKIHVLLHVLDGYLNELEVYREDSARVQRIVRPEDLNILIL